MNRSTGLVGIALLLAAGCGDGVATPDAGADAAAPDAGPVERRLVILHTNDEHSHLFGWGPELDDFPIPTTPGQGDIVGNVARRATALAWERAAAAAAGIDTLTVSAGDETQGTLVQLAFAVDAPDFRVLEALDYDVMCPGNHEFDQGPGAYAAAIQAASAAGGIPQIVATNIRFDDAEPADDGLAALYGEGDSNQPIKRYHVLTTPSGVRVGFFGVMGVSAAFYAPLKAPVRFSGDPADEGDYDLVLPALYEDLRPTVQALRDVEQVDVVVMVSHGGVDVANPQLGDDQQIAANVAGIDVIVSGHTHTALLAPIVVMGPDGHPVPIVQAGFYGQYVGRIELVLRPGERPTFDPSPDRTKLIPVDDRIVPDQQGIIDFLDLIVRDLEAGPVLPAALEHIEGTPVMDDPGVLGDLYFRPMGMTDFDVIGLRPFQETNVQNLATDSMLATAEELFGPTAVAVQGAGSVRADLYAGQTGVLGFSDLFRVLPLGLDPTDGSIGYPLTRFYMWTAELKAAFEIAVSKGLQFDALFLAPAGMRVEYDPSRPPQDLSSLVNALDPNNGRVTRIEVDTDHSDGWEFEDPADTLVIFELGRAGGAWTTPTTNEFTLWPVVTSLYVASFADTAGVTLKDELGNTLTLAQAILHWPDGSSVKDYESFIRYVRSEAAANGGRLPSRYDETAAEGLVPRRMLCVGTACP